MGIETLHQAELWVERYLDRDGGPSSASRRLPGVTGPWWTRQEGLHPREAAGAARSSLSSLVSAGTLFSLASTRALAKAGPLHVDATRA